MTLVKQADFSGAPERGIVWPSRSFSSGTVTASAGWSTCAWTGGAADGSTLRTWSRKRIWMSPGGWTIT
jgi:hypothetical protein